MSPSLHPWRLRQLLDTAFPTGGFAHSGGLEAAMRLGIVRDAEGVADWLRRSVEQARMQQIPLLAAAHEDPQSWRQWDEHCDQLLTLPPTNRASRQLGAGLLMAGARGLRLPELTELVAEQRRAGIHGHLAPAWGVLGAAIGLGVDEAADAYAQTLLRDGLSAAIRLGLLGPLASQELGWQLAPELAASAQAGLAIPAAQAATSQPLLEICQGVHPELYTRLFHS